MNESRDLDRIERRAYQTIWEDGLLDLFVGAGILAIGLSWISRFPVLGAVLPALLVPAWQVAHKQIAEPRTGYVKLSRARQARQKRSLQALALLGVATMMLGVAAFFFTQARSPAVDELLRTAIPALPAVLLGIGSALAGMLFEIRRLLAYAGLLFAGGAAGAWLHAGPGWHFLFPGIVIVIVGVTMLVSFLRKYPAQDVAGFP